MLAKALSPNAASARVVSTNLFQPLLHSEHAAPGKETELNKLIGLSTLKEQEALLIRYAFGKCLGIDLVSVAPLREQFKS